jgi:XTP/dITP diphosphohydrolase
VDESESTLIGNARLKARAIALSPLNVHGHPAVADDTGLFVDAVPGELGVRTARYASDDPSYATDPYGANRRKLLLALSDHPELDERRAHFVTVVVVLWPDGREIAVEGRCDGVIALEETGARGFGFDPLFVPTPGMFEGDRRTFAEMSDAEKNELSHRGRAFRAMAERLRSLPAA